MIGHHQRALAILLALARITSHHLALAQVDPEKHQEFADDLTALLYAKPNECSSALGVSMAFSLIYPGSTNDATDEIKNTFGYPGGKNDWLVWEETSESMMRAANGEGDEWNMAPLLSIANSVWFDDNSTLMEEYADVVGDYALQTDFSSDDSPLIVNEWVENSTNGLIDSIVDPSKPLFPSDVLLAINSIYLKAQWSNQFEVRSTSLDTFYTSPTRSAEVGEAHFMHQVEDFDYSSDVMEGYQILKLPFESSDMAMILVLPTTEGSTDADVVRSTDLLWMLDDLESTRVALAMPKFKFESEYKDQLKDALMNLGLTSPFAEGTESLCMMLEDFDCNSLVISKVIQKTVIDANEKGVEAAAVTAVGVSLTSAGAPPPVPVLMMVDHPFQFFIYDEEEELMLFEGRVGAPEVPEGKPEMALLSAKHADVDFWEANFYVSPIDDVATTTEATTTEATTAAAASTEAAYTVAATMPAATTSTTEATTTTAVITTPTEEPPPPLEFPASHQEFADDLTALLYKNENECSSALGVSMAFSLLWPGCATDDAIDQVRNTLGYPGGTNLQLVWEDISEDMVDDYDGEGGEGTERPLLEIAYSVWHDDGDTLSKEYRRVVEDYALQTNFTSMDSGVAVNDWVEESTNGLIQSIVPTDKPLFPPYVLLAISSVYLKARWLHQFQEGDTNLDKFYTSATKSKEASEAHFMHLVETFPYSDEVLEGYQVIDLPFGSSQMSMIFVLPTTEGAAAVKSTDVVRIMNDDELEYSATRVALALPKFKFESTYEEDLVSSLKSLGIEAPFTAGSGALCGLFEETEGCENIVVDNVIQKTIIDANEKGVEAAAVTAIMAGATSFEPPPIPVLMVLDHPFQFFIYDKEEELMLFEGRVGAPQVPEGAPAVALLEAQHADEDFWSKWFGVVPTDPLIAESALVSTEATKGTTTEAGTTTEVGTEATTTEEPAAVTGPSLTPGSSTAATTTVPATTSQAATTEESATTTEASEAPVTTTTEASEAPVATTSEATEASITTAATTTAPETTEATTTTSTASSSVTEPAPSSANGRIAKALFTSAFLACVSAYVL